MTAWRHVGILALAVTGLTVNVAVAKEQAPQAERSWLRTSAKHSPTLTSKGGPSYGQWAAGLALLGLGGWAVWRRRRTHLPQAAPAAVTQMKITALTRISPKAQIVAVRIQGRTLLVGATDQQITHLGWLEEDGSVDGSAEDDASPDPEKATASERNGPPRRRRESCERASSGAAKAESPKAVGKPSRFRELLADAMGFETKRLPAGSRTNRAPVDELVDAAEDRYVGHDHRRLQTQRMRRDSTHEPTMIDVEGQAQGLVARLNRPPT